MKSLRLETWTEVSYDPKRKQFCIERDAGEDYDLVYLSFDAIEQLYTWAASVHEGDMID
jgi:hypothetical protein